MILSYFYHLEKSGRRFYGGIDYLASSLGLTAQGALTSLSNMESVGLIRKEDKSYLLGGSIEWLRTWHYDAEKAQAFKNLAQNFKLEETEDG